MNKVSKHQVIYVTQVSNDFVWTRIVHLRNVQRANVSRFDLIQSTSIFNMCNKKKNKQNNTKNCSVIKKNYRIWIKRIHWRDISLFAWTSGQISIRDFRMYPVGGQITRVRPEIYSHNFGETRNVVVQFTYV